MPAPFVCRCGRWGSRVPEYLYRDAAGHERPLVHRMLYSTGVVCDCGRAMHRVPRSPRINWNGSRAGQEPAADVQRLIADAPRRRDWFRAEKEKYEDDKRRLGRD